MNSEGEDTTNHIESFWSELKRLTNSSHGIHGGVLEPRDRIQLDFGGEDLEIHLLLTD